jgi:hypothetical protein
MSVLMSGSRTVHTGEGPVTSVGRGEADRGVVVASAPVPAHPRPTAQFGRWTVINRSSGPKWLCRCACGTERAVAHKSLTGGTSASCGCLRGEQLGDRRRTHGGSRTPIYDTWRSMIARCIVPSHIAWPWYGGLGVTVCKRWQDFLTFCEDVGPRPPGTTLDRIDNERGYEPGNVRWATSKQQAANRRPRGTVANLSNQ